jgi:uncharacterized repeat protein (TIGR03803 family)
LRSPKQRRRWISKIPLGAATGALILAVTIVLGVAATQSAQAQTFTDLHNFTGPSDGANPLAGLVRDAAGNLYGTTTWGGSYDYGTVFDMNTKGTETVLYSFTGGAEGGHPYAGLARDAAGNLYGTTAQGGASGNGTAFRLSKTGKETVLHSFTGGIDGKYPWGGLLRDKGGNLYGTTVAGGASGYGTVFKLSKTGQETVLDSFTDVVNPYYTGLLMDELGNLFGVTESGGNYSACAVGCGTVYKLSKSGALTVLHEFLGGTDGCNPVGTPVTDKNYNLYGTTAQCGSSGGGTVWKLGQKGHETVLHNFVGGSSDGFGPDAGVIMDAKGNLYGDTQEGGTYAEGAVYELNKKGTLTLLHSFAGSDGSLPRAGVIRDSAGDLYGTTSEGGSDGYGTVWKVTP